MHQLQTQINYGDRLTALREKKGWTRERLAATIHVSYDSLRRTERNQTALTVSRAEAIALAYGMSVKDFWNWMAQSE